MKNTIIINGKLYDAISGLPVGAPDPVQSETTSHHSVSAAHHESHPAQSRAVNKAKAVHRKTQRSQTLRRDILKSPAAAAAKPTARRKPEPGHHTTSPLISKFAPHPQPLVKAAPAVATAAKPAPTVRTHYDIQPARPHTAAAHPKPAHHPASALSSRELKEKLIAERLASVPHDTTPREHKPKRSLFARAPRVSSVVAVSLAIVFLGGYLTYINMPNLSMRVAAARAGVDASFPDYRPDGYRFDGPIAYNNGEVSLKFASNTNGTAGYTINQQNSNWDSQSVLDNYVAQKSQDYLTYSEHGLTIYTFDGKAAWVNGGVFYTIEGNAPLSTEQILHIAGSM